MDGEVCYDWFCWKFGGSRKITLTKTSQDEGIALYFDKMGGLGSTFMDIDGNIHVTIHDAGNATASTWYEELMHAKQNIDKNSISYGIGGVSVECEVEVAACLLKNAEKIHLTPEEIELSQRALEFYSERL